MRSIQEITEQAFALHREGKLDQAEQVYDQLIAQLPEIDPNVFFGYGTLLSMRGQYGLAAVLINTALTKCDTFAPVWNNLGVCYKYLGLDDKALAAYERSLALDPKLADTLASISGFWLNRDASDKAEEYARRALAQEPNNHSARMHLGFALLEQGRFTEAWPYYESRWNSPDKSLAVRPYESPRWNGGRVGKLIIHGEQGLGDEILFMSLFREAQSRAGKVVIECATRLVGVFAESFAVRCYGDAEKVLASEGHGDAHIPMGSLPLVLGLPDGRPYLKRAPRKKPSRPRIGIAWKGGVLRTSARERTLKLSDFAPILKNKSVDFVSVQYGGDDVDQEAEGLVEIGSRGFNALHDRIASCDLVISVCQTAVHQAGAMGVPCWVLTPRKAAWRYCGENMLPWYESVSLFRQDKDGNWAPVIERVARELEAAYAAA